MFRNFDIIMNKRNNLRWLLSRPDLSDRPPVDTLLVILWTGDCLGDTPGGPSGSEVFGVSGSASYSNITKHVHNCFIRLETLYLNWFTAIFGIFRGICLGNYSFFFLLCRIIFGWIYFWRRGGLKLNKNSNLPRC